MLIDNTNVALSIEDALARLATYRGSAQLIANGTSLGPRIARGEFLDKVFISISRILILHRITEDDGMLQIGGAVTFAQIATHPLVLRKAPLLTLAASRMLTLGRGLASLAGDTVSALPMALGALALVAMQAEARVVNLTGSQWLPVASLFHRNGACRIDSTSELIASYRIPAMDEAEGVGLVAIPDDRNSLACALRMLSALDQRAQLVWALRTTFAAPCIIAPGGFPLTTKGESEQMLAQRMAEAMLSHLSEYKLPAGQRLPRLDELALAAQLAIQQARTRTPVAPASKD